MIFYYDGMGNLIKSTPEPVYQGSDNANTVYFVAPFITTAQVSAKFTLPTGEVTSAVLLTSGGAIAGTKTDENGNDFAVWFTGLTKNLTAFAGDLRVQFSVTLGTQKLNTQAAIIEVSEGVAPVLPQTPAEDIYDDILATITLINNEVAAIKNAIPQYYITDITADEANNTITITYSNGTTSVITLPDGGTASVIREDWLRKVTFTEESFVAVTGGYALILTPTQTQFSTNDYIVQLSENGSESYEAGDDTAPVERQGETTLADAVFKGSDGTLYVEATAPYAGRLLLLGGNTEFVNQDEDVLKSPLQKGAIISSDNTLANAVVPFKVESKNLIPFPYIKGGAGSTYENKGITYSIQADGGILLNGTVPESENSASFIELYKGSPIALAGTTITASYNTSEDLGRNSRLRISSATNALLDVYSNTSPQTITVDKDVVSILVSVDKGVTLNNVLVYFHIEYGETATSYTPYVPDGTAAQVVACGKNLFNAQGTVERFTAGPSTETHLFYDLGKVTTSYLGNGSTTYVMFAQKYPAGVYSFSATYETVSEVALDKHVAIMISIPAEGFTFNSYYNAYSMANYNDLPSILINASEPFTLGLIFRNTNNIEQENAASYSDIMLVRGDISDYEPYSGQVYSTEVGESVEITQQDKYTNVFSGTDGVTVSGQFILSTQYELNDKLTPLFGTFANRPTTTQPYTIMYIATDQTGDNKVTILPANADGSVSGNWITI